LVIGDRQTIWEGVFENANNDDFPQANERIQMRFQDLQRSSGKFNNLIECFVFNGAISETIGDRKLRLKEIHPMRRKVAGYISMQKK